MTANLTLHGSVRAFGKAQLLWKATGKGGLRKLPGAGVLTDGFLIGTVYLSMDESTQHKAYAWASVDGVSFGCQCETVTKDIGIARTSFTAPVCAGQQVDIGAQATQGCAAWEAQFTWVPLGTGAAPKPEPG
ncbi:hypothetical protein [Streptomyces hainanensis]|uniref:Uncharacterized protein n=1 Tax=Streptomyces hainanensis TaxID=402648 RepID=A0A4R4TSI0_9ACTN|nr:hypothetical protein [Streptomyces hainanensis]TDC78372.1 hypothetical protein E1283_05230 [Streptomyces hainanensis]